MFIPSSGMILWPYATPGPPAGNWTREANFNDRFFQGHNAGFAVPANGGAASHNHTDSTHTHTGNGHTHSTSAGAQSTASSISVVAGAITSSLASHSHTAATTPSATVTYQNTALTLNTATAKPAYIRVIAYTPDDDAQGIPDDCLAFTDEAAAMPGFAESDGTGGTLDLDGLFPFGAEAAGEDGGDTGGSATHTHVSPVHTHTPNNHAHAQFTSGPSTAVATGTGAAGGGPRPSPHHKMTPQSSATSITSDAATVTAKTSEPAYVELLGVQNTSGGPRTPIGTVIPYLDTEASLPHGWELMDGNDDTTDCTDVQIKISSAAAGGTGGLDAHTHTVQSHGHTASANHTHVMGVAYTGAAGRTSIGILARLASVGDVHTHTWTTSLVFAGLQNFGGHSSSSDDGRYNYRTVIWVKLSRKRASNGGIHNSKKFVMVA